MFRWLLFLLLALNLGVFAWGWRTDRPGGPPPPAQGRAEIRLLSELPPGRDAPAAPTEPADLAVGTPAGPLAAPVSAYDRGAVRPGAMAQLPETTTERVDPGLLPDELLVEPPVIIPPVRDDDEGVRHTWSR